MRLRALAALGLALLLSGCSYTYTVLATMIDGQLAFIVDPKTPATDCLNQIEVRAEGDARAEVAAGDNAGRIGYGTFWAVRGDHQCRYEWPIRYGTALVGPADDDLGKVTAKPLQPGVIYRVSTVSGSTGYGGGRFILRANGTVENLPPESAATGNSN